MRNCYDIPGHDHAFFACADPEPDPVPCPNCGTMCPADEAGRMLHCDECWADANAEALAEAAYAEDMERLKWWP